ncbi:MAG TPA: glycosyltransferase family 61 protein [Chitinophagaceae bacterium]|nr:glycosyltransferase family 61 protein [Chitinophagaceae bacterium]
MRGYYSKLFFKTIKNINYRINGLLVKKILAGKKTSQDNESTLISCYKNSTLLPQHFLILNGENKILVQHVIPSTYKNPFIHLTLKNVLQAFLLYKFKSKQKQAINKAFVWGNNWSAGYYHFVAEDLPKLIYMRDAGMPFYTWKAKSPAWRDELLSLFKTESNIITAPVPVNQLCYIANNRIKTGQYRFSIIHPALCATFAKALQQVVLAWGIMPASTVTWISRKYTFDRNVTNEDECIKQLQNAGVSVTVIYPEKLTVKQQIMAVYNTAWIIGPHGAGLTNILFTAKANIIEIGPDKSINNAFTSLAGSLNRQYRYIKAATENKFAKNRTNFYIDRIDAFAATVQQFVSA